MPTTSLLRRTCTFGVAVAAMSLLSLSYAKADSFQIVGGSDFLLGSGAPFDPAGWVPANNDGITNGITHITVFNACTSCSGGLNINGGGTVNVTFTYLGYEAGDTNVADGSFAVGTNQLFINNSTTVGSAAATKTLSYNLVTDPALLPFLFDNITVNPNLVAKNGGAIDPGTSIGFYLVNSTTVYAFFDDSGAGPDSDYDDMVVKIQLSQTPLPAALPLFASGLGALGVLGWRRKRKAAA